MNSIVVLVSLFGSYISSWRTSGKNFTVIRMLYPIDPFCGTGAVQHTTGKFN